MYKRALLINKDGKEFSGWTTESFKPTTGELIFNTGMTGFVEMLSDPSYVNQILSFTSSHIGNYGISDLDFESSTPKINATVGNSFSYKASSWRSLRSIPEWLKENHIPFCDGFDSREIARHISEYGSSMFALGVDIDSAELKNLLSRSRNIIGDNSALTAGSHNKDLTYPKGKIGILDLGTKNSIINVLLNNGHDYVLLDPKFPPSELLALGLKGLLISNGPGDPRSLNEVIENVKQLIGKIPIFGICLGHQILSLACGLNVDKLKFGHHGSNHPVKVEGFKNAIITSQNHGFATEHVVDPISHKKYGIIESYAINLNDMTNQGISIWDSNAYSVQFHPESGPGTSDGLEVFQPFFNMIDENYAKK
jgi:carbamoyl-phosphate synthase small subunit